MTGYLLARAGVEVAVLEKHADFNRDFRGDTIHPSTLELMHELGLLEEFLKLPHQELRELRAVMNGHVVPIADFSHLPTVDIIYDLGMRLSEAGAQLHLNAGGHYLAKTAHQKLWEKRERAAGPRSSGRAETRRRTEDSC